MSLALALFVAVPVFTAARVLPANSERPSPLSPGLLMSIYGDNLGPVEGCTGYADTRNREIPNPAVPRQMLVNTLIYPKELCGVQVLAGDRPAGLLWVQAKQINFKVPQEVPLESTVTLRVVYNSVSSAAVLLKTSALTRSLVFEGPLTTLGPVWVKVLAPPGADSGIRYPFYTWPTYPGCHAFEVRRNGTVLKPRAVPPPGPISFAGNPCGSIGLPGPGAEPPRDRIPLHLFYEFDQPGVYEVRYFSRASVWMDQGAPADPPLTSWTRLEIRPWSQAQRMAWLSSLKVPENPALLLTDYIPAILGHPDGESLRLLVPLLYHREELVRRFAQGGLGFWPKEQWEPALLGALQERGPVDVVIDLVHGGLSAADLTRYLQTDDPVLLRGALRGLQQMLVWAPTPPPAADRAGAESALLAARTRLLAMGDAQTRTDYTALLGSLQDPRAGALLWEMVAANESREQALIAIAWRKNPADLPRLAAALDGPGDGNPLSYENASLPYQLRANFGDAATPYLVRSLRSSRSVWVRTNCARELIFVHHPAGFAFAAEALETNQKYAGEMVQYLKERFPELRNADNAAVLAWLTHRAR